jgi:hypothetical protein
MNAATGSLAIDLPVTPIRQVGDLLDATLTVFRRHFLVIAKIVLLVFLPVEFAKNYLLYVAGGQESLLRLIRIEQLLEIVFGSPTTPALIYALIAAFRTSQAPSLRGAFRWGRRQWARTLGNRWLAGMALVGGLILLVVPGFIFAVMFCLVDPIVAIEGDSQPHVLRRSRELTSGHRWMLFAAGTVCVLLIALAAFILGLPQGFLDLEHWLFDAVTDCLLDVWYQILHIMLLLASLSFMAGREGLRPATGAGGAAQS